MALNIVLVEPRIPQNAGNIARTCAATGSSLHLVYPMAFNIDDKKLKRAGLDYWDLLDVHYYDSLADFLKKAEGAPMVLFSTKAAKLYTEFSYPDGCYLIFGREDAGLPENFIADNYENSVRLPMLDNSAARSLNLSNSVAVAVYEALRQNDFYDLRRAGRLTGRAE